MGSYDEISNVTNGSVCGRDLVSPVNCLAQMGSYAGISDAQEAALSGDVTTQEKSKKTPLGSYSCRESKS